MSGMNVSEEWLRDYYERRLADQHRPVAQLAASKPSSMPRSTYRSKTEAAFALHLDLMMKTGSVVSWKYEAVTLKLANKVRYTPDFLVIGQLPNSLKFIEIKGRKGDRFWSMPVSKVKIRLAASLFPYWEFQIVWPSGRLGAWDAMTVR